MTFSIDPEVQRHILDKAVDEIVLRAIGIEEAITGPDGETFGDIPLTGGDFVAFYVDLASRGVLDHLDVIDQAVGSKHGTDLRREFDRQFAKAIDSEPETDLIRTLRRRPTSAA